MNTTFTEPQDDSAAVASMTLSQTQQHLQQSLAGDETPNRKRPFSPPSPLQFKIPAQFLASQESCRLYFDRLCSEANLICPFQDRLVSEILAAAADMSGGEGGGAILMEVDVEEVVERSLREATNGCDKIAVPVPVGGADGTFPPLAPPTSTHAAVVTCPVEGNDAGVISAGTEDNGVSFKFRRQVAKKLGKLKKRFKDCFQGMKDFQEEVIEMALDMASESLCENITDCLDFDF